MVTAAIGGLPGPRRLKEATLVSGLAVTFLLCIATARQFLEGSPPSAFADALRVDGLSALVLVLCGLVGLLSGAVEPTTLASVFLITFHDRDTSLEAGWKSLVLGSLGLAFALLGTVLMFAAGRSDLGGGMSALHWTRFMEVAPELHPFTLRLGVVFALIGY